MKKHERFTAVFSRLSTMYLTELIYDSGLTPNQLYILTKGLALCGDKGYCTFADIVDVASIGKVTIQRTISELIEKGHCVENDDGFVFCELGNDERYDKYRRTPIQTERNTSKPEKQKRTKAFIKPTIHEIRAYIFEKGYEVDADAFFLHYESNGWMIGKAKMKNWHAAVGTWNKKNKKYGNTRNSDTEARNAGFARHIADKLSRGAEYKETLDAF